MKVLVLSATTGGGHMTAANALKEYILMQQPDADVLIIDTIQYVSPFINKAVTSGYIYMVRNTPTIYGGIYNNSDKTDTTINKTVEITTSSLRNKLLPLIEEYKPDILVSTHPFSLEIASSLKTRELIDIPLIGIVTDFAVHQSYVADGVDAYIVSSREMVDDIVSRGIDRVKVYPYGIPVKQSFYKEIDRAAVFREEELDENLPTVLIMAGSFGVTDVIKIYHKIVKSPEKFQIVVITGKNEKLYETFERYLRKIAINNTIIEYKMMLKNAKPPKKTKSGAKPKPVSKQTSSRNMKPLKPTKLLYFTDEVEKYMHMADVIVTKPGGLTVSESIASELPMAIFKAIPGQEEQNADFLVSKNMAIRLKKDNTCTATFTDLIRNPQKLADMKQAIRSFSKGNSAANIYLLMCELIEKYKK